MENSMTTGTPWKRVLSFSIPVFVGLLLQQLYNTVDTIVVGNFASEEALAAVGTTASMITLFLAAAVGFSTGAGVITAQYFGAGQKERMKETSAVAVTFLLVMGIIVTVLGLLLGRVILSGFLDVPDSFLDIAVRYFNIYCLGLVFQFGYNIVAGLLRSVGDSKASMYFLLIAAIVNIVLDVIFVAGLHWGASGAAAATGISQAFSCIVSFVYMNRKYPFFHFGIHDFKWDGKDIRMILRMDFPIVLQQMLIGVGIMAIQRAVNSFGQSMTASFTVGSRIEMYVQMPLNSFNMALGTFVGQNIGAGKKERIAVGVKQTLILSLVITLVMSAVVYLFQGQIIRLFALSSDAEFYCRQHLTLIAAAFILQSVYLPLCGVFQGAGDGFAVTRTAIFALCVRVLTTYTLGNLPFMGYRIVWWNIMFGFLTGCIIAWTHYLRGTWKTKTIV